MKQMTQKFLSSCNFSVSRTVIASFSLHFNLHLKKSITYVQNLNISRTLKNQEEGDPEAWVVIALSMPPWVGHHLAISYILRWPSSAVFSNTHWYVFSHWDLPAP